VATPEERIRELGIELPGPAAPAGSYVPTTRAGSLVFVSGSLPRVSGELRVTGKLGREVTVEQGYQEARQAIVNALGSLRAEIGSLDRVRKVLRVEGHVASAEGFTQQPQVINGASDLLNEIFGERGLHTRLALGAAELPLGAAVEIAMVVDVEP